MTPTVLLEDNHCLVVSKPAGMLAQGDATGDSSLVDWATDYLRVKYRKPGNVFVGLVHRLDRPTSGVVLLARTSKAASRLADQFRTGEVRKTYLAICEARSAALGMDQGTWVDHLLKDERTNVVDVVGEGRVGSRRAEVDYRIAFWEAGLVGVVLRPRTGRGHQLRVQLAARGLPILGDSKYGSRRAILASDGLPRIALHASKLQFAHPTTREPCEVQAPLPSDWPDGDRAWGTGLSDSSRPEEHPSR